MAHCTHIDPLDHTPLHSFLMYFLQISKLISVIIVSPITGYRNAKLNPLAMISAQLVSNGKEVDVKGPIQLKIPLPYNTHIRPSDSLPAWTFDMTIGNWKTFQHLKTANLPIQKKLVRSSTVSLKWGLWTIIITILKASVHNFFCVQNVQYLNNKQVLHESIFQTMFLACPESLRYT